MSRFRDRPAVLAIVVLALGSIAMPSLAGPDSGHFRHQKWSGGAYLSKKTGTFSHCAMAATYTSGTVMGFAYYRSGLTLLLGKKDWDLGEQDSYDVTVAVDDAWRVEAKAVPRKGRSGKTQAITIRLGKSREALRHLRQGSVLTIKTAAGRLRYKLTGTSVALRKLHDCFVSRTAPPAVSESANPFAPRESAKTPPTNNPFAAPSAKRPREAARSATVGERAQRLKAVAAWSERANVVAKDLYAVLKVLGDIDNVGAAYIEGKILLESAKRRSATLLTAVQQQLAAVDEKLQALPAAPDHPTYPNFGTDMKRFLDQFRDQAHVMHGETKSSLLAAFSEDKNAFRTIKTKQINRYIILLNSENVQLDLQSANISQNGSQFHLNKSIVHSNTAVVHILTVMRDLMTRDRLVDMQGAVDLVAHSLREMEQSIDRGLKANADLRKRFAALGDRHPSLGQSFDRLLNVYADAFDVEQQVRTAIGSMARDLDGVDNTASQQGVEALTVRWESIGREIERLSDMRIELHNRKIAIVKAMKFR